MAHQGKSNFPPKFPNSNQVNSNFLNLNSNINNTNTNISILTTKNINDPTVLPDKLNKKEQNLHNEYYLNDFQTVLSNYTNNKFDLNNNNAIDFKDNLKNLKKSKGIFDDLLLQSEINNLNKTRNEIHNNKINPLNLEDVNNDENFNKNEKKSYQNKRIPHKNYSLTLTKNEAKNVVLNSSGEKKYGICTQIPMKIEKVINYTDSNTYNNNSHYESSYYTNSYSNPKSFENMSHPATNSNKSMDNSKNSLNNNQTKTNPAINKINKCYVSDYDIENVGYIGKTKNSRSNYGININNKIQRNLGNFSNISSVPSFSINPNKPPSCNKLIESLKSQINQLKVRSNPLRSNSTVDKLKNEYEENSIYNKTDNINVLTLMDKISDNIKNSINTNENMPNYNNNTEIENKNKSDKSLMNANHKYKDLPNELKEQTIKGSTSNIVPDSESQIEKIFNLKEKEKEVNINYINVVNTNLNFDKYKSVYDISTNPISSIISNTEGKSKLMEVIRQYKDRKKEHNNSSENIILNQRTKSSSTNKPDKIISISDEIFNRDERYLKLNSNFKKMKEENSEIKNENSNLKMTIEIMKRYIKFQEEYIVKREKEKIQKKNLSNKSILLDCDEMKAIMNQNRELKLNMLKILYVARKYESMESYTSNESEKLYSQLLTENNFLRKACVKVLDQACLDCKKMNSRKKSTSLFDEELSKEKVTSLKHKRQDTKILASNVNSGNRSLFENYLNNSISSISNRDDEFQKLNKASTNFNSTIKRISNKLNTSSSSINISNNNSNLANSSFNSEENNSLMNTKEVSQVPNLNKESNLGIKIIPKGEISSNSNITTNSNKTGTIMNSIQNIKLNPSQLNSDNKNSFTNASVRLPNNSNKLKLSDKKTLCYIRNKI